MTFRMSRISQATTITLLVIGMIGASLTVMFFAGPAAGAKSAEARATKIFDGDSYASEPEYLTRWPGSLNGSSKKLVYIGGVNGKRVGVGFLGTRPSGEIRWTGWGESKAVGIGRGYTFLCPRSQPDCGRELVYPWTGTRLIVTAYRKRSKFYTRLKIATQNYRMWLKEDGYNWAIVKISHT